MTRSAEPAEGPKEATDGARRASSGQGGDGAWRALSSGQTPGGAEGRGASGNAAAPVPQGGGSPRTAAAGSAGGRVGARPKASVDGRPWEPSLAGPAGVGGRAGAGPWLAPLPPQGALCVPEGLPRSAAADTGVGWRAGGRGVPVGAGAGPSLSHSGPWWAAGPSAASSAAPKAEADWKRAAGDFSRACITASDQACGRPATSSDGARGTSRACATSSAGTEGDWKGTCPTAIW